MIMDVNINELLSKLTLEEKAALCSGVDSWNTTPISRLGIPSVTVSDGPHGLRKEMKKEGIGNIFSKSIPATCFPTAVTLASSWDKELLYEVGKAIGEECLDQDVQVILGPGINIKRNPLCGRNFEYFSEDTYLTGELSASYIQGVQSQGVGVSLKHYALNSQEHKRMGSDSIVDERALREIYLKGFEKAVKQSSPHTIMCSYNKFEGVHVSHSRRLLNDILRNEWGFDGIVISDWGAVSDRVKGIVAGLNIEMPSSNGENDRVIVEAVRDGRLEMSKLDKVVADILRFVFRYAKKKEEGYVCDYEAHHALARRVASEANILLKNDTKLLPLTINADKKMTVIGMLAEKPRYQGSGSSMLEPKNLVGFLQALENDGVNYEYAAGYDVNVCSKKQEIELNAEAVSLAKDKDYIVYFMGLTEDYESEAYDRSHLDLPKGQVRLLEKLKSVNKNIIVVLCGGSPVTMEWANDVSTLLNVYLGGEAGGEAILDNLLGRVNPSGRLAETYAHSLDDILSSKYYGSDNAEYRESIFVGYRYFDTAKKEVAFPFGYGLSYTKFLYEDIELSTDLLKADDELSVKVTIKNIGEHDGAEVVQLYVKDTEASVYVSEKELKGFEKVFLRVGEEKKITFKLDKSAFAFYNSAIEDWYVEEGEFRILIGASSRDIRLSESLFYQSPKKEVPNHKQAPVYFDIKEAKEIPIEQFEVVLNRKVPRYVKQKVGKYTMNTLIGELNGFVLPRLFRFIFKAGSTQVIPKDSTPVVKKMTKKGAMYMPIRNMYMMSGGTVSKKFVEGLLKAFNKTGIIGLIAALKYVKNTQPKKSEIYK